MSTPLTIAYAGSPEFACPPLNVLAKNKAFEIKMAITQPDRPAGRGQKLAASAVKEFAKKYNFFIQQPENIADIKDKIAALAPDYLVVVAYGQLIPEAILNIPKIAAINLHASLLPRYRGASPIQEAILQGDRETGISVQIMNKFLDRGDILAQEKIPIKNNDTYLSLSQKLSKLGADTLPEILIEFSEQKISPKSQNEARATYCRKISKEDGLLNFNLETAQEQVKKLRAFTPWPGCFTFLNGRRVKVIQAHAVEQKISPGEWFIISEKQIGIGCKKGSLILEKVQPEGKQEMNVADFARGYL